MTVTVPLVNHHGSSMAVRAYMGLVMRNGSSMKATSSLARIVAASDETASPRAQGKGRSPRGNLASKSPNQATSSSPKAPTLTASRRELLVRGVFSVHAAAAMVSGDDGQDEPEDEPFVTPRGKTEPYVVIRGRSSASVELTFTPPAPGVYVQCDRRRCPATWWC